MKSLAVLLDVVVVLLFALAGRASHELTGGVAGMLETAWPFLVGLAVGWLAVLRQPADRRRWWLDGATIAVCALVIGILLRVASGGGAALPFVLVATGVLVLGLVGWRGIAALIGRRTAPAREPLT